MRLRLDLALLIAVILFAAAPTVADDENPWFVDVGLRFVQPTNLRTAYTLLDPNDDFDPEGTFIAPEMSTELTPKVEVGRALDDRSGFSLTLWTYDETLTDARASGSGNLTDSLFHPAWSLPFYQGTASAELEVEAEEIGLGYYRRVATGDAVDLTWRLGLRQAALERNMDVLYDDGSDPERVVLESEMNGLGVATGIDGRIRVSERWSLIGGASVGLLAGSVESSHLSVFVENPTDPVADIRRDEDRTFVTVDLYVGGAWTINGRFEIRLDYGFGQWSNVYDPNTFPDDINAAQVLTDTGDVGWNGLTLTAGLRFGS